MSYLLIGILCIIFAIICYSYDDYSDFREYNYVSYLTYGGDAYTGMQNAAAATANNVQSLQNTICCLFYSLFDFGGYMFLIVGLLLIVTGINGLIFERRKTCKSSNTTMQTNTQLSQYNLHDNIQE